LQSVLRIVAALLFLMHGTQKLFGVPADAPRSPVALMSQMGLAGVLELFGGLLLLLGLGTGPVALVLAAEMAAAYLMAHAPGGPWPILNGGELALLYAVVWLYLAAAGPGPWSIDARRKPREPDRRLEGRIVAQS
jgi:putative oxidoreductase